MIQLKLASDGGIEVDTEMRSSCDHIYAAGDACTVQWSDKAFHWFQVCKYSLLIQSWKQVLIRACLALVLLMFSCLCTLHV